MMGITFSWPTTPSPGPQSLVLAPSPIYFFTAPKDGIIFTQSPASKITFSRPLVIIIVCHVFFNYFKQNSAYSLFENFFQQNVLSHTNQLQCESIGCFLCDAN